MEGKLFGWQKISSITNLRGILVCSLNVPELFRHMLFWSRFSSLSYAIQSYFLCFLILLFSLLFLQVVKTHFDYFRKPISPFSKFSLIVSCLLMFYSNNRHSCVPIINIAPDRWWPRRRKKSFSGMRKLDKIGIFRDAFLSRTWCSKGVQT